MRPTANWYTALLQSSHVTDVVTSGMSSSVAFPISISGSFSTSSLEHDLEFTDTLKIQFEPIRIHMRMKNAKQSHMRRDLSNDSLSVFIDASIVMV